MSGIPDERQFPAVLTQKLNALVLVLEHRFYGHLTVGALASSAVVN